MRYFDTTASAYRYVSAGTSQIMGPDGPQTIRIHNGIVTIGKGTNRTQAAIRLLYADTGKPSAEILKTTDTIISSLADAR
jgi:hypothetical protein